jgi:Fur family ferric uptake transcriptional regulator
MTPMPNSLSKAAAAPPAVEKAQPLGQRQTRQRDAILQVLHAANGPLPVPEIHSRAQQVGGKIGIATVYRTLKLLLENAQIQAVRLPSGETCYQGEPHAHHDHFQCRNCNQVFDLDACPLRLKTGTVLQGGFVVEDHQMLLYGLCPNCH